MTNLGQHIVLPAIHCRPMPRRLVRCAAAQLALVALLSAGCGRVSVTTLNSDGPLTDASIVVLDAAEPDAAEPDARPDVRPPDDSAAPRPLVYASDSRSLYTIDPDSFVPTRLLDFILPEPPGLDAAIAPEVYDIAIDRTGTLVAAGRFGTRLYRVDLATGACTEIDLNAAASFFALAYVPAGVLDPGRDVLVGATSDGFVYRIYPDTGAVDQIGATGAVEYPMTGDLVWTGDALLMTLPGPAGGLQDLARIDLATGHATLLGDTRVPAAYGLAWTGDQLVALGNFGAMATIDPATGAPVRTHRNVIAWSGAATAP